MKNGKEAALLQKSVLFTASTLSHIRNFHLPYLYEFRERGWKVCVAYGGERGTLPEADELIWLPLEKKMTAPSNLRAASILRRAMRAGDYDLVIAHTSLAAFFTRLAAKGLRCRPAIINVAHGYLFDDTTPSIKRAILEGAESLTAAETDLLLTMNRWDDAAARRHQWGKRVSLIPGMGLDISRFSANLSDGDILRKEWNCGANDFVLIYAAEFSLRKNQAFLLRAMPNLPQNIHLVLPGQGALLENCRTLTAELGISDRVYFPGQVREMPRWLAAADAAVSSSRSEGLPFNVMEAMASHLPIVASCVKGHTDLVEDGKNGFLYPREDEPAYCEAVIRLSEDAALTAELGKNSADFVKQYDLSLVVPTVMEQYLSVLDEVK